MTDLLMTRGRNRRFHSRSTTADCTFSSSSEIEDAIQLPIISKDDVQRLVNIILDTSMDETTNVIPIDPLLCVCICATVKEIFIQEKSLINVINSVKVCGDIHGQFQVLKQIFGKFGLPPSTRYLFLGDYVDRGTMSLEVMILLFSLKILFPNDIFLLRGNHESELVTSRNNRFKDELEYKYHLTEVWHQFTKTFDYMPLAALVNTKIFCCHGGLSPFLLDARVSSLDKIIGTIQRPCKIPMKGLVCDLLWAEPSLEGDGWIRSKRGNSWLFGPNVVKDFLKKYNLDLMIRSHQFVPNGHLYSANNQLLTIHPIPHELDPKQPTGKVLSIDVLTKDEYSRACNLPKDPFPQEKYYLNGDTVIRTRLETIETLYVLGRSPGKTSNVPPDPEAEHHYFADVESASESDINAGDTDTDTKSSAKSEEKKEKKRKLSRRKKYLMRLKRVKSEKLLKMKSSYNS